MVVIHKMKFEFAQEPNDVWKIYRFLKTKRNLNIVDLLKEIQENYLEYKEKYKSEDESYKSVHKVKKTPEKLIKLLNQTKDEELRAYLREEIKKLIV